LSQVPMIAQVWPGGEALRAELRRRARGSPGGMILGDSQLYTFQGVNGLLAKLWSELPFDSRPGQLLSELAGPLLVQSLLADIGPSEPLLAGLGRGRRFPHRLWRLLVGLKSAGLTPEDLQRLEGQGGKRRLALARLLGAYQAGLAKRNLLDEAAQLAAVEKYFGSGRSLPAIKGWQALQVKQALWLRPMDLRLLRVLSRLLPVEVEFALTPSLGARQQVFKLLEVTARALESDPEQRVEVAWRDLEGEGGPLARLALAEWTTDSLYRPDGDEPLELHRAAGRYGEVEALLRRAQDLMQEGVAPHDILLVFPSLTLYGQMAGDVAARLGLPLSFRRSEPLDAAPLAQALADLLVLPLLGYPRDLLARVWDSPYLGQALARLLGVTLPTKAGSLLARAGYVDARETPVSDWLAGEAGRHGHQAEFVQLARACGALTAWLSPLDRAQTFSQYTGRVARMLERLDLAPFLSQGLGQGPWTAQVLARDLNSLQGLKQALDQALQAAEQVGDNAKLSPGRLHALLGQAWQQTELRNAGGVHGGIKVLRLEDAQGLKPHTLLVGGLSQGEFPARPQDLHLLSGEERIALGRVATLPVWRTEEEEYSGQILRLLLLLASARHGAMLCCPAAGLNGAPQEPSLLLTRLAVSLGREKDLTPPGGSLFGELPALADCRDSGSLWGGLAQVLLKPAIADNPEAGLAQALLAEITKKPDQAKRWQSIGARAKVEEHRRRLEVLPGEARLATAGSYDGRMSSSTARDLLHGILAAPQRRRLSPSTLESFAACPMAWFMGQLLGLPEPLTPGWDLERSEEGRWVHRTLAAFFEPTEFDPAWDRAKQKERLAACLAKTGQNMPGHQVVSRARERVLLKTLPQVVSREMADMGEMLPSLVEKDFGDEQGGLEVPLPGEAPLLLHGILDRLDRGPDGLRVVDYKHSNQASVISRPLKKDDLGTCAFQMPVYVAGAREFFGKHDDALQARVVPTRRPDFQVKSKQWPSDDPFFARDGARRQDMIDQGQANLYNGLLALWQRLSQGQFIAQPSLEACGFCSLAGACRSRENPAARGAEA
jgi:PD-(D/E)XK nuclease superfamily protein